jgi:hypothetical protein
LCVATYLVWPLEQCTNPQPTLTDGSAGSRGAGFLWMSKISDRTTAPRANDDASPLPDILGSQYAVMCRCAGVEGAYSGSQFYILKLLPHTSYFLLPPPPVPLAPLVRCVLPLAPPVADLHLFSLLTSFLPISLSRSPRSEDRSASTLPPISLSHAPRSEDRSASTLPHFPLSPCLIPLVRKTGAPQPFLTSFLYLLVPFPSFGRQERLYPSARPTSTCISQQHRFSTLPSSKFLALTSTGQSAYWRQQ